MGSPASTGAAPRRILIAQTSFLGDVVLTTPLAAALAAGFPGAEIWWLVRPDAAPIVQPLVAPGRVLVLDKRGADRSPLALLRQARHLHGRRFDVALAVQRSLRTAGLLAAARIPRRIGFAGAPGAWLYHETVSPVGAHAAERLLCLVAPLLGDGAIRAPRPHLVVDPPAAGRIAAHLHEHGVGPDERIAVLAPGAAWATKRWPAERFAELAVALAGGLVDRVVVIGTPADRERAARIDRELRAAPGGTGAIDLTGRTDTAELVAILARATIVVANDSAPGHVAAALGRPTVSLFGPTVPAQGFAPLGEHVRIVERELACRPCSRHGTERCPIGTHECLALLPAGLVARAAGELLGGNRSAPPADAGHEPALETER